jgi:hypothetical protein
MVDCFAFFPKSKGVISKSKALVLLKDYNPVSHPFQTNIFPGLGEHLLKKYTDLVKL